MKTRVVSCIGFLLTIALWTGADGKEIGFVENFALATDRSAALKQLVPGTDDYYYYNCVHAQNTGKLDRVNELLSEWVKRHRSSPRIQEIRCRQLILRYPDEPAKSLDAIRRHQGIQFNHQKQRTRGEAGPTYPSKLDSALLEFGRLRKLTLSRHKGVSGFTPEGIEILPDGPLNSEQRRDLLKRIKRAEAPNIVDLISAELGERQSRGFGSLGAHMRLSLAQLAECLKRHPRLLTEQRFVNEYLARLVPNDDVDIDVDRGEKRAYLGRLRT